MWPLRSIAYFIFFWVTCAASLINPIWGVVNYILVYQANPTVTWWGKPITDLGLRFSLIAVCFTMVGLFTGRKYVPEVRPVFSPWELGAFLLVAIAAVTLFTGFGPTPAALFEFEKFWKEMLFVMLLTRMASTRTNLRIVVWTLVVGSLYLGYDAYTAPSDAFVLGRLDKIGGPDISTTSGAAAHLVAMLPIIGAAFLCARRWPGKLLAIVSGAFVVNAIILCRTRSAFVGFLCGTVVAVLIAPRARRFRIHFLLIIGALSAYSLTDNLFWKRMSTLTDERLVESDRATAVRKEIWEASIQILEDHPFGIGPGNFTQVIGDYDPRHYRRACHNSVVGCFVELGIQGGIVFLCIVLGSIYLLYRSVRLADLSEDPLESRLLAYGFFISLVTYFVTALGTQRFYCESFWWVLCLPLCLYRSVTREIASPAIVPELSQQAGAFEEFILVDRLAPSH